MQKEILESLRGVLKEELQPIKEDINVLKEDVSVLKEDVSGLKEDVNGLKEDVNGLKEDVNGLKEDVSGLKEDVSGLKEDVSGIKDDIKDINIRIGSVENKTDRNTLMLEDMNKKLQTIAEVQSSFQGQLGRSKDREGRTLSDRLEVIELAVKDTSQGVKSVQRDLARVVRATGENWAEIIELKSRSIR